MSIGIIGYENQQEKLKPLNKLEKNGVEKILASLTEKQFIKVNDNVTTYFLLIQGLSVASLRECSSTEDAYLRTGSIRV